MRDGEVMMQDTGTGVPYVARRIARRVHNVIAERLRGNGWYSVKGGTYWCPRHETKDASETDRERHSQSTNGRQCCAIIIL
jgi:hypothetical protein